MILILIDGDDNLVMVTVTQMLCLTPTVTVSGRTNRMATCMLIIPLMDSDTGSGLWASPCSFAIRCFRLSHDLQDTEVASGFRVLGVWSLRPSKAYGFELLVF